MFMYEWMTKFYDYPEAAHRFFRLNYPVNTKRMLAIRNRAHRGQYGTIIYPNRWNKKEIKRQCGW
jgi:hypothetical protein